VTEREDKQSISIQINGRQLDALPGQSVLEVCRDNGVDIPTLCHDPRLSPYGACRLCIVEVDGLRGLPASCTTRATDGMVVRTDTETVERARKTIVELLLSDHKIECLTCEGSGECKLQDLAYRHNISTTPYEGEKHHVGEIIQDVLIDRDLEKCIACGRCVRICAEVQGRFVYDTTGRGFDALPQTPFANPLSESNCEFCGQCVSTCPTGALSDGMRRFGGRTWETLSTETTCGYCGVGCTLTVDTHEGRVVGVRAPVGRGVNDGNLCPKGRYGWGFTHSPERLTTPLVRRNGELVAVSWDEALTEAAAGLSGIRTQHGPEAIGGLASAKCVNEENYLFQKLMRAVIGTHNIDHCARLCHASTVAGLAASFGSGAMTNSIPDLREADVILVIGSNTAEAHPIIGVELKKAARAGTRIIVVDPRRVRLADHAERYLPITPGTNTAFINAVMSTILAEGLADEDFIARRTEGFEELRAILEDYDIEAAADICGIPAKDIRDVARIFGQADSASIIYSMGVTQHTSGTDQVRAIANLAMLTGNIGRPGTGVNPLRGQNNVQGACDLACLPNCLPGYQPLSDQGTLDRFCDFWETEELLPTEPGLTLVEMMTAAAAGDLKAMYIMGENPVIADPDQAHVIEALEALDFLVVQDIFMTETASFADVILPAATFLEKEGTFTNTERRIQRVRKAVEPPGEARPDLDIIIALSAALGSELDYENARDVMDEMVEVTPQYSGITYARLEAEGGLQWPCPDTDHPGTPILHAESFTRGLGQFAPVDYIPAPEQTSADRPLIMTTGRHLWNFHTNTMTGHSPGLAELNDHGYVEMHSADAERLGICDKDTVRVTSAHGIVEVEARVGHESSPRRGVVFMPFHFADAPANRLTGSALDPQAKIPGLKVTAVNVELIG